MVEWILSISDNIAADKSKAFAVRIIKLYKYLTENKKEYTMSKQLLRCGTGIGANLKEATYAQSRADFVAKIYIAMKETAEAEYWLEILKETEYINPEQFESMDNDCKELLRILLATIKTTKANNKQQ